MTTDVLCDFLNWIKTVHPVKLTAVYVIPSGCNSLRANCAPAKVSPKMCGSK